jgi:CheY-like chemotaxis protein
MRSPLSVARCPARGGTLDFLGSTQQLDAGAWPFFADLHAIAWTLVCRQLIGIGHPYPPSRPGGAIQRKDNHIVKARILVVDDERDMCAYLCDVLQRAGYQVGFAYNGLDALNQIDTGRFDLVLADVKMPGLNGLEMLRRIKERDEQIVVIMMTAYSMLGYAIEAVRYGAFDYLTKPFASRNDVLTAVSNGLAECPAVHNGVPVG